MTSMQQQEMFGDVLARARDLVRRGRAAEAREILEAALRQNPDNRRLMAALADLHYRNQRYREAAALAGAILRRDPNDPRGLVLMGNVLRERRKPREALPYFELALRVAETDYLWLRLARCHLDLREPAQALAAIGRAETLGGPLHEILRLRAEAARQSGDNALEQETLRRAEASSPADPRKFAEFWLPLLQDLPPRRALILSERLRERPGQETHPDLLRLEARLLRRLRQPDEAAAREALLPLPAARGEK